MQNSVVAFVVDEPEAEVLFWLRCRRVCVRKAYCFEHAYSLLFYFIFIFLTNIKPLICAILDMQPHVWEVSV